MTEIETPMPTKDGALNRADPHAGLSIIIPAYNEEHGVGPVVAELKAELESVSYPYEIVVVDDGSVDATAARAAEAGARLVEHEANRGYGAALKTGIRSASYPLICITDADGTYPKEYIPRLVEMLVREDVDMVVGARVGENVEIPLIRRPAKWVIRRLAEMVAGRAIPDLNSGLRVMKRKTVMRFFQLLPEGFSFTTTITLAMLSNAYRVRYIPIDYRARVGRSKIRPIRDTLNFVNLVLRIALYFAPLKIFVPLSLLLVLLSVAWGVFSTTVLGQLADVSTLVIFMTAVQVAVVGLLAELIARRVPNEFLKE